MTAGTVLGNELMISIIVPVYNVTPYVEECLESIYSQAFSHAYEVILIDDCSTDSSIDICRRFIEKNHLTNFTILKNSENQGVSVTRNRGLEEASGHYFMFVDPDDCLAPGAIASLYDTAEQFSASIVKGNNTIFNEQQERAARYNVTQQTLVSGQEVLTTLYQHDQVRGHPWGKLFRRDQLGAYRFPLGVRMAQDLFYCSEVFSHADSLLLIEQNVYRYRDRDSGSTGSKFDSGSYLDWLDSVEKTVQFARTPGQMRAHKNLLVRTMAQLARECRQLPKNRAEQVLSEIEQRCKRWNIRLWWLVMRDHLGLRSLARYFKMRQAIRQSRQNLRQA